MMKQLTMRLDDGRAVMRCEECKEGRNGVAGEGCTAMYCRNMCKDRLAAYEDTGLMPRDIEELLKMAVAKTDKVLRLEEDLHAMKNELCQHCGKYKHAHEGVCDGCRWRER